jgi:hypothetical protein
MNFHDVRFFINRIVKDYEKSHEEFHLSTFQTFFSRELETVDLIDDQREKLRQFMYEYQTLATIHGQVVANSFVKEIISQEEKVKIKLFETHFAWISSSLLSDFQSATGIKRRSDWIKKQAKQDFGITLSSSEDIPRLDMLVRAHYYDDKAEWLKEKMRESTKKRT